MSSINPRNYITNTTMLDFQSRINQYGGPARNCRFGVRILFSSTLNPMIALGYNTFLNDLTYLCEAAEFPGRGFDTMNTSIYGPDLVTPFNTLYGEGSSYNVSFICRTEGFERQMFDDWLEVIQPTHTFNLRYPETYWSEIQVYQLADYNDLPNRPNPVTSGKATYLWSLHDAWPAAVQPQPVNWADTDVLRLGVSFMYRYWSRPGRDGQRTIDPVQSTIQPPQNPQTQY